MQPDLIIAYEVYSQLHFNQGNYQQVINDCNKILSITPDDAPALLYMSLAYINLGNYNKAEETLNKMPANSFFQNNVFVLRSYIDKKNGNVNDAKNFMQTAKNRLLNKFAGGDDFHQDAVLMFYIEILEGNKTEAYQWLNKAVDYGFRDYISFSKNPVTEDFRNEKQFQDIIQKMIDKVKDQQKLIASANTE